jgi:hypothetical protein
VTTSIRRMRARKVGDGRGWKREACWDNEHRRSGDGGEDKELIATV